MRLAPSEVAAIKAAAASAFGADAIVRLFGSRLDDGRRGGDIDLLVELQELPAAAEALPKFRRLLDRHVGERDYDILLTAAGLPASAVVKRALSEGVVL